MTRAIALIAGLGLALGTATSAVATDEMPPSVGAAGSGAALQGEVTENVDDTLTIRGIGGERVQVRTTESTRIHGEEGELEIGDIETGDHVRVTALDGSQAGDPPGLRVAREIRVEAPGADESGTRDPRQMMPQQNPTQGIPDAGSPR